MEKHYELDKDDLTQRIDDINAKTGPFVRAVIIANHYLHPDGEKLDYPNAVKMLADAAGFSVSAKNETLASINSMMEELSELSNKIEADLLNYSKLSTEWYTLKHDLDFTDAILVRLNASRDVITSNIDKVEILIDELKDIKKYIGEHPIEGRSSEILYAVTDPSGEQVEHLYILQGVK